MQSTQPLWPTMTAMIVSTASIATTIPACGGDESATSELTSGSGGASTTSSSTASGSGKALPCGGDKLCENVCCIISPEYTPFCAPNPGQCPAKAFIETQCNGSSDCASGEECCGNVGDKFLTVCRAFCAEGEIAFCDSQADCTTGTCKEVIWKGKTGYNGCQP